MESYFFFVAEGTFHIAPRSPVFVHKFPLVFTKQLLNKSINKVHTLSNELFNLPLKIRIPYLHSFRHARTLFDHQTFYRNAHELCR